MTNPLLRTLRPGALLSACVLAGCSAGYPPPTSDTGFQSESRRARAAQVKSEVTDRPSSDAAKEVEARLFLSEAGKVLVYSIRMHGGWDAWLALGGPPAEDAERAQGAEGTEARTKVSYSRTRSWKGGPKAGPSGDPAGKSETVRFEFPVNPSEFRCPCDPRPHEPHLEGPGPASPGGGSSDGASRDGVPAERPSSDLADEYCLFTLPFLLASTAFRQDYLGMEADGDALYEKVRYSWLGSTSDAWLVAWFDRHTWLLRRVLLKRDRGPLLLVILSGWQEWQGLEVPAKREWFHLRDGFSHWSADRPDCVDLLADFARQGAP